MGNKEEHYICSNCSTTETPLWRRGPDNCYYCNACGLYYRIHHRNRPKEYCSIEGRKRNRVKKEVETNPFVLRPAITNKKDSSSTTVDENIAHNIRSRISNQPKVYRTYNNLNLKNRDFNKEIHIQKFTENNPRLNNKLNTNDQRDIINFHDDTAFFIHNSTDHNLIRKNVINKDKININLFKAYLVEKNYRNKNLTFEEYEAAVTLASLSWGHRQVIRKE